MYNDFDTRVLSCDRLKEFRVHDSEHNSVSQTFLQKKSAVFSLVFSLIRYLFLGIFSTVYILFSWEVKHGEPPSKWLKFYGILSLYKSAQQKPWNYAYLTFTNNNNNIINNNNKNWHHHTMLNCTSYSRIKHITSVMCSSLQTGLCD